LLTYPLVLHFDEAVVAHWSIDIEHSLWLQWWFAKAVESPSLDLFRTPLLHFPFGVDLQFADINLGIAAPFYVVQKLCGLTLAYNALLASSFVATGLLTWRFVRSTTHAPEPIAWVAGLLNAASAYWIACTINAWMFLVHTWVFPLVLIAARGAMRTQTSRAFVLLGLALALSFHVSPYYCLYSFTLLTLLSVTRIDPLARLLRDSRAWIWLFALGASFFLAVAPRAIGMLDASSQRHIAHHEPLDPTLAAPLREFVVASRDAVSARAPTTGYMAVFVGYTLLACIVAGFITSRRRRDYARWLIPGAVLMLLSMGPCLKLSDTAVLTSVRLPGYYLQQLPIVSFLTNHWRWMCPAMICLTQAAAIGLTDVVAALERTCRRRAIWVSACALALFVAELVLVFPFPPRKPLWIVAPPPIALRVAQLEEVNAVMDTNRLPKISQIAHGKAIVAGWLPRLDLSTAQRTSRLLNSFRECENFEDRVRFLGRRGVNVWVLSDSSAVVIKRSESAAGEFVGSIIYASAPNANDSR